MAIVLFDCDGVLSNFVGHLFAELKARGLPVPEHLTKYEVFDALEERSADVARQLCNDPHFWGSMPRHDEAVPAVEAVRKEGHEVVCVTAPWSSCTEWEFCRRAWLVRNYGFKPFQVVPTSFKSIIFGDVLIEDKHATIVDWKKRWASSSAFLMDRPWNKNEEASCPRINWDPEGVETLLRAARALS